MNLKEIEKVVASIQSHLFRNSNSFSIGMLKSHFKGAGLQFKEHQLYSHGDDVRFIDWKLSAKSSKTYVKTFEEERNIEIISFLDISETMFVGYKGVSKLRLAIEITCLLYLLAEKSKDKVKTIIYTDKATTLPPLSGQEGITFFVSMLEKIGLVDQKGNVQLSFDCPKCDHKKKMSLLKSFVARRKEVVFLSDLYHFENLDLLLKLIYRKNMHCFKITSPLDKLEKFPYSVFVKSGNSSHFYNQDKKSEKKLSGRYKILDVSQRYLEGFIREML